MRERTLSLLLKNVQGLDEGAVKAARAHWDGIAKPLSGLGSLEEMVIKIAGIQRREAVSIEKKAVCVFCADNGVVAEGVTQTDSGVTAVMTENFAKGIASVNRMAAVCAAEVIPVDMGVASEPAGPGIRPAAVRRGTGNIRREPAMSRGEAVEAVHAGLALAGDLAASGCSLLAAGEMGIGNTTTAAALMSVFLDLPVTEVTGRGAGLSTAGLERKRAVIADALALHRPDPADPIGALAAVGGLDIAGICGLLLGGAVYRVPVVLDGVITLAAALAAKRLCPAVTDFLLASHLGKEPACAAALAALGLRPVIDAQLGLGEGTGAVLLFPMLDMAVEVYRTNATFADIHIEAYRPLA